MQVLFFFFWKRKKKEKKGEREKGKKREIDEIKRKGRRQTPGVLRTELKATVSFSVSSRLFIHSKNVFATPSDTHF